jgi:two-component system, chemotaxis family, protein-glutamate methylesterase/glutaminase
MGRAPSGVPGNAAVIVIGTSMGGLPALHTIVKDLPESIPAAICVVQHIGDHASQLPALLSVAGRLPVVSAKDGEPFRAGTIYVAPPARHLIVGPGHLHLTRGPRENHARPAIDPLFRSAAEVFGRRVIGVILTGQLNDGTAGLFEIKRRGGIAIAQDPSDAEFPAMPQSALDHVAIEYCVPASAMGKLLNGLATRLASSPTDEFLAEEAGRMNPGLPKQRPIALTCPECGGATRRSELGTLVRFDCHIGHGLTAEVMAAGQVSEIERGLEAALRRMNERIELCRQMGKIARSDGDPRLAEVWRSARVETEERVLAINRILQGSWMQPQEEKAPAPRERAEQTARQSTWPLSAD